MSDASAAAPARAPRHLWVVGILSLLWNAMGAFDYLMTQTRNAGYMGNFTPEQLEYFYGFPSWAVALWALAVWGAVLGSVLLLLRKRLAVPVFLVSFLSMVGTTIYNFGLSDGWRIMGGLGPALFSAVIFFVALGLVFYSRRMRERGVLA
jgi:hypothetical protein